MRILNLLKYFPPYHGGIENFACDLVEELAKNGVDETVISHGSRRYSRNGVLKQILSASYGELLYAPVAPTFPFKLFRELQHARYDLLHIHVPNVSAFWPLIFCTKIPYIVHWHADVIFPENKKLCRIAYKFYAVLERLLLAKAAAIVVTSENYLQQSQPLKAFRKKCSVIPLGLNFERMTAVSEDEAQAIKKSWTGARPSFLVVSAGRFSHYKGFGYLIEAVSDLKDVTLVIAGEGEMRAELLRKVKSLGLEDKVILPGKLSDRQLHSLLAACDLFVLPSIARTEAFGVVLLEAMYYGKPLITTEIAGSATSLVNQKGKTGLTVPVEDFVAISEAITVIKNHPELGERMGRSGRERLEQNFSISKIADNFYQLYSSLL